MQKGPSEIINGLCYIDGNVVNFIDIVTERCTKYKRGSFEKFIQENGIDETYIILSNYHDGLVTPLYKYKVSSTKNETEILVKSKTNDQIIDLFYKICIKLFPKNVKELPQ